MLNSHSSLFSLVTRVLADKLRSLERSIFNVGPDRTVDGLPITGHALFIAITTEEGIRRQVWNDKANVARVIQGFECLR
jgi:hypothetical protein